MLKSIIKILTFATISGALSFVAFFYLIVRMSCWLLVCDDKSCVPGAIASDIASPDKLRSARIYHSFCGPPGGSSNSFRVVLRANDRSTGEEFIIFRQENDEPLVRWTGNDRLSISPGGWDGLISLSEHQAKGVSIDYAVDLKAMSDAFANEQKRISDHFGPDQANSINAHSNREFGRFRSWVERNVSVSGDD